MIFIDRSTKNDLTLRSGRRPRLEGSATARLLPTKGRRLLRPNRDATLRVAPQGEVST